MPQERSYEEWTTLIIQSLRNLAAEIGDLETRYQNESDRIAGAIQHIQQSVTDLKMYLQMRGWREQE